MGKRKQLSLPAASSRRQGNVLKLLKATGEGQPSETAGPEKANCNDRMDDVTSSGPSTASKASEKATEAEEPKAIIHEASVDKASEVAVDVASMYQTSEGTIDVASETGTGDVEKGETQIDGASMSDHWEMVFNMLPSSQPDRNSPTEDDEGVTPVLDMPVVASIALELFVGIFEFSVLRIIFRSFPSGLSPGYLWLPGDLPGIAGKKIIFCETVAKNVSGRSPGDPGKLLPGYPTAIPGNYGNLRKIREIAGRQNTRHYGNKTGCSQPVILDPSTSTNCVTVARNLQN